MRIGLSIFLAGFCLSTPALAQDYPQQPASNSEGAYDETPSNVVYVETSAPLVEPEAIAIEWAPPPLIVEEVGISPMDDAFWIGGYWAWADDRWCWARGRWVAAPQPGYVWASPYYENRGGRVIYVGGYWRSSDRPFVSPSGEPREAHYASGWQHGPRVSGPSGTFVPAPPGSRPGMIVPAPAGTPPRVMASQPAIVGPGMTVRAGSAGRYQVSAPATAVRSGRRIDAAVASGPPRTGEKPIGAAAPGARPTTAGAKPIDTPPTAKTGRPNLDPSRAAAHTIEREEKSTPAVNRPASVQPARISRTPQPGPLLPGERKVEPHSTTPMPPSRAQRPPTAAPRPAGPAPRVPMAPAQERPVPSTPAPRPMQAAPAPRPMQAAPTPRPMPEAPRAMPAAAPAPMAAPHAAPAAPSAETRHH